MPLPTRMTRGMAGDAWDTIHREFDGLLNRVMGGQMEGSRLAPYAVDVREEGDHLLVEAELPGFKKEEIDITLENQTLTIAAERKEQAEQRQGEYLLNERRYSRFLRSFTLPPTVDDRSCDAKLLDGVLTIKLNKREESKPRKVQVT